MTQKEMVIFGHLPPCDNMWTRTPNQPALHCSTVSSMAYLLQNCAGKEVMRVGNREGGISNWFEEYIGIRHINTDLIFNFS